MLLMWSVLCLIVELLCTHKFLCVHAEIETFDDFVDKQLIQQKQQRQPLSSGLLKFSHYIQYLSHACIQFDLACDIIIVNV